MNISQRICAWFGDQADDAHARFHSWEHCYRYFQRQQQKGVYAQRDQAALQLGFYLASWGMYRGSSFLLQHAYTIHLGAVDLLASTKCALLWTQEFGSEDDNPEVAQVILDTLSGIRETYEEYGWPTDTLLSKVLLGAVGCLPACDRYFIDGFKRSGFPYGGLNRRFVDRVYRFCRDHLAELREEQARIQECRGMLYPLMKIVDMYFHQLGQE